MTDLPEFIVERIFDAPRALVWKAWSDPELLAHWYGPGLETVIHEFDLRPGGVWRNEMKWGENSDLSQMSFQEVVPEEKIVWHHASTDSDWNVISSPMMPEWPRVLLTTVTLENLGEQTKQRLHQVPLGATEAECACFAEKMGGMEKGWGSGFAIIEKLLADMRG